MWLSDISPLRAGTVGSLSDNNLAEINVPFFASSVNRFLTFSSKRTILGVFYSFPVHNYVISTKNKLPLAVYFPVSYTEIGAGISRKKSKPLSKATMLCLFPIVCNSLSCPTMPSQAPKSSASRAKGNDRRRSGRRKRADGLQFSAVRTRKRTIFVQISEHKFQYSPISEHVRCFQDSCAEHIGTPSSFSRPGPNASQRPYI